MKDNKRSILTIVAGEFTHQTADTWRKSVSEFKINIGRYIYNNNKEHQFTKRIEGFKNNSELIFNFIKSGDNIEKFFNGLSIEDKTKILELNQLKSTQVEIYDGVNKRYKTRDEVIDDLYRICAEIELQTLGYKIIESNKNTKYHTVDLAGDPDATCSCCSPRTETVRELKLMINRREVLITDEDILVDKSTTQNEIFDIVIKLLNY